jgi:hypothetical protein
MEYGDSGRKRVKKDAQNKGPCFSYVPETRCVDAFGNVDTLSKLVDILIRRTAHRDSSNVVEVKRKENDGNVTIVN